MSLKIGLLLSKENQALSKAEAEIALKQITNPESAETDQNYLILEASATSRKTLEKALDKLALTKEAHIILKESNTMEELEKSLLVSPLNQEILEFASPTPKNSFRITLQNLIHKKRSMASIENLARAISLNKSIGKAKMKEPDIDFHALKGNKAYLAIKIWKNKNEFKDRESHKRPYNHPTSLDPRTARAMINLSGTKKEVLDPFCGAGGILIEAGKAGIKATGLDFDSRMVERARANTAHYKTENCVVEHMNALDWNKTAECIVTDIPYGKNSRTSEEISNLLRKFLEKYEYLTKTIVIAHPDKISIEEHAKGTKWEKDKEFRIYIHKSLTRIITILVQR